jgi:hypothetical protein
MKSLFEIYTDRKYLDGLPEGLASINSDKNTHHSYIKDVYEEYFTEFRDKEINLLEIGVSTGASLRLWREYFSKAKIYGIDPFENPEHKKIATKLITNPLKDVTLIVEDAYRQESADSIPDMDLIIDDGPHNYQSQVDAIKYYLPKLKPGGYMFIEDIPLDWQYNFEGDDLCEHPFMKGLINEISEGYEYKIFDMRRSKNIGTSVDRGDNIILAINNLEN